MVALDPSPTLPNQQATNAKQASAAATTGAAKASTAPKLSAAPSSSAGAGAAPPASSSSTATVAPATTSGASTAVSPPPSSSTAPPAPREHNPRWKGYIGILLSSLINLSAVSNIQEDPAGPALSFGVILFVFAFAVLVTDRIGNKDWYTATWDGKLEGYSLIVMTLFTVIAVAFQSQVGGIAYLALNVYFSAWLMLASCLYTLNEYSKARDILTFAEMTSISATLKSWYILFLASLVVTGTSINMYVVLEIDSDESLSLDDDNSRAAAFGTAFGLASTLISLGFILVHYNMMEFCVEGGWTELFFIAVAVCIWIVGVPFLTQDQGIAATIVGTGYRSIGDVGNGILEENENALEAFMTALRDRHDAFQSSNADLPFDCILSVYNTTYNCTDLLSALPTMAKGESAIVNDDDDDDIGNSSPDFSIPGSNLYLSVWISLLSSLNLANRWKTQQALQFAQAQRENAMKNMRHDNTSNQLNEGGNDSDDDFEDADDY